MAARTLLTCLALVSACAVAEAPDPERTEPVVETTTAMPSMQPSEVETLGGVVQEVQSAGHYTYVRVGIPGASGNGDWAVVMGALGASAGDTITLSVQGSQTDFHSRRLDRDFERLFFASVPSRA